MIPKVYKGEKGYLQLMSNILKDGIKTPDRTDVGSCTKLFNQTLYFDLRESFPASTVRPMSLRYGFEELMLFLRGQTDTKILEEKGINFWKGHTSREFLDSRGLYDLEEGGLGKSYSYQYRGDGEGRVDQIAKLIEGLQNNPYSRRHCVDIWAPNDHDDMPLLPCWKSHQFNVEKVDGRDPFGELDDVLHLTCEVRSSDALFGLPNNYQQFAFYLKAMAEGLGMEAGTLACNLTDVHIYDNQVPYVEEVLTRDYQSDDREVTLDISTPLTEYPLKYLTSIKWGDIIIAGLEVNTSPFVSAKPRVAV